MLDTGELMLNGCKYDKRTSESIGFVPQNDQLFSTLSVLETLKLHAKLRASGTTADAQFDALLETLDLQGCMHTRIGEPGVTSGRRKGVSGGERKRIAIALELLHEPPLLVLDEPTSGLDSAAALHVTGLLATLARGSQAVLISLHQPSSRAYAQVAHLGLLTPSGHTAFFGPAAEAIAHFERAFAAPLPPLTIPVEHFLDVLAGHGALSAEAAAAISAKTPGVSEALSKSVAAAHAKAGGGTRSGGTSGGLGLLNQSIVLFKRAHVHNLRHPAFLRAMVSRSVTMALIVGHLYSGLSDDQGSVQDRVGALYFVLTNQIMSSSGSMRTFLIEREIARHELAAGLYSLPAYFAARSLAESAWQLASGLLFSRLTYSLVGFAQSTEQLYFFLLAVSLVTLCAESYSVLIGAVMPDDKSAAVVGPLVLALFMVSGGLFVKPSTVPYLFRVLNRVNVFSYGFSALLQNEMDGLKLRCTPEQLVGPPPPSNVAQRIVAAAVGDAWPEQLCPISTGEQVVASMSMDSLGKWESIVGLLCIFLGFRLLAFWALRRRFARQR